MTPHQSGNTATLDRGIYQYVEKWPVVDFRGETGRGEARRGEAGRDGIGMVATQPFLKFPAYESKTQVTHDVSDGRLPVHVLPLSPIGQGRVPDKTNVFKVASHELNQVHGARTRCAFRLARTRCAYSVRVQAGTY